MVRSTRRAFIAPAVAAVLVLSACGSDGEEAASGDATDVAAAGLSIDDPWVREPAVGQTTAAGYGVVTNGTDETITLIGASAPVGGTFEVHETSVADDGTMSMGEQEGGFEIAPGESLTLEPGGAHIMMLGIDPAEFTGPLDLTFVFDTEQITTSAELREIGDAMDMDEMDEMDEMEMDDADS